MRTPYLGAYEPVTAIAVCFGTELRLGVRESIGNSRCQGFVLGVSAAGGCTGRRYLQQSAEAVRDAWQQDRGFGANERRSRGKLSKR